MDIIKGQMGTYRQKIGRKLTEHDSLQLMLCYFSIVTIIYNKVSGQVSMNSLNLSKIGQFEFASVTTFASNLGAFV